MTTHGSATARRDAVRTLLQETEASELAWDGSNSHQRLAEVDARAELEAIAHDRDEPATLRFKACEALIAFGVAPRPDAAEAYLGALDAADGHDAFGFPGLVPSGAGARIVGFGRAVLPALVALTNDTRPLVYDGSEEPTLALMRGYRVKDLAAVWLASLLGERFDVEPDDPAVRDAAIASLVARASH